MKIYIIRKWFYLLPLFIFQVSSITISKSDGSTSILHMRACTHSVDRPGHWHIRNLYDCQSNSLFIPYQLWTGSKFDGNKTADCMHKADLDFVVLDGEKVNITGPEIWKLPETASNVLTWVRTSANSNKVQRFICHDKGIGRVFDSRRNRYFSPGRCKFPAGYGWRLNVEVECKDTKLELIKVDLTKDNSLKAIEFKWWYLSKQGHWNLDYIYRYSPGKGMTHAWKQ